ncbi:hypothetical protein SAMN02745244_03728 [Tessaracoccus bendigoensis DSM 12906]|uniref:Uncharacterized protein n=1 Tax=Tessaracoccus bendigoensis DSM 12906 TaxID=1123357 RepID=A0A1M6NVK9_9ACTN|nr:hypothetical protein [Tessaracoccus bendigoensis]SHJ99777.1 hypothetical protein SAMN02745244_03728 [Tessaracoccus bendigoensis DSM 12906]
MSDEETQQLIVAAKGEAEACDQLVFWTQQLQHALDARRQLLDVPPEELNLNPWTGGWWCGGSECESAF